MLGASGLFSDSHKRCSWLAQQNRRHGLILVAASEPSAPMSHFVCAAGRPNGSQTEASRVVHAATREGGSREQRPPRLANQSGRLSCVAFFEGSLTKPRPGDLHELRQPDSTHACCHHNLLGEFRGCPVSEMLPPPQGPDTGKLCLRTTHTWRASQHTPP